MTRSWASTWRGPLSYTISVFKDNSLLKMDGKNAVVLFKFLFTLKKIGKRFGASEFFAAHYA